MGRLFITTFLGLAAAALWGQPIPTDTTGGARYVFTVYSPLGAGEATVWRTDRAELTTHRARLSDSSEIRLVPARTKTLRTYVDLGADAHTGTSAGAMPKTTEQGSPVVHELLTYSRLLSPEQRQVTESYLALRHGLTLDQTLPTNYLAYAADGAAYPVWTATEAGDYRHRIFGLANEPAAGLDRRAAYSAYAPELVRAKWLNPPSNSAYVVFSDDDAPTARGGAQPELPGVVPLRRTWRVERHGSPAAVELGFSADHLFAQLPSGQRWVLLVGQPGGRDGDGLAWSQLRTSAPDRNHPRFVLPAAASHFRLGMTCTDCSATGAVPLDNVLSSGLSPNPMSAGGATWLRIALANRSAATVRILDVQGRLVRRFRLPPNTHHLSRIDRLPRGSYVVRLDLSPAPRSGKPEMITLPLIVQ